VARCGVYDEVLDGVAEMGVRCYLYQSGKGGLGPLESVLAEETVFEYMGGLFAQRWAGEAE